MSGSATREMRPAADRAGATGVMDADRRRARATENLLGALAPALGIDVGTLHVRSDEEAAARTRGRGARGLAAGATIWIDPGRYDPLHSEGRALLAHEAAHVAQRAEARTRPDRRPPSLAEAEREAVAIAAAVREGRPPPLPRATLPPGAVAADTGAAVAEAEAAAKDDEGRPDPLESYRGWSSELDALVPAVRQIHARRIVQIGDRLDGLWVSDGDVDDVLTVLEPVAYVEAAALVRALAAEPRLRLVDNISPSHRREFRPGVLAACAGLLPSELAARDKDMFDGMPLLELSPEERFLAIVVVLGLSHAVRKQLIDDPERAPGLAGVMAVHAPDAARLAADRKKGRAAIDARSEAEAAVARDPATERLLARLQAMLRKPTATAAEVALDELAALLPAAAPATAPTEPAPAAPVDQPPPAEPVQFRVVVETLEQTGAVDRLIRALPESDRLPTGPRRAAFVAVIGMRSPDANLRLALDLLGTGFLGGVSDSEARLAYDIVRALPLDARDRFLRRDDGVWLERLEDSLPADVLERGDFADLGVARDEHGALVDSGLRRAQQLRESGAEILKQILGTLDEGGGAETADTVVKTLVAIDTPAVREAVIGRLDSLRRFDGVLERLDDNVLLSEDRRADLTTVLGAREPRQLERHIRRLLATGVLDWAVTSREAFLAFLMLRALPAADRERFGRLDFVVGELSPEMRASAGVHMVAADAAAKQRDGVHERLGDERMWTAEHAPELRALIQIAVALGDRRWVFEQSELRRAWEVEALQKIVSDFELYNPVTGHTDFVPKLEQKAGFFEDYGLFSIIRIIGGVGFFLVSQGFKGTFYVDPWAGQTGIRELSLVDIQDALGGELGPARLSERETEASVATNELTVVFDPGAGTLRVDLPALELDSIGMVSAAGSLHTGAVTARGIKVQVDFATDDLSQARTADIAVADVSVLDLLAGATSGLTAVTRVHLAGFGASGDLASLSPSEPRSPVSGMLPVPLVGPIIEVVRQLITLAGVASETMPLGIRAELASFEVEGVALPGDHQIASISAAGIKLAWGWTRAQYLRSQIDALDNRITAAAGDAERDRLGDQRKQAADELSEVEKTEPQLLELVQRARTDPGSMTEADHRNLIALQQQGPGGLVVDTGPITIRGVGGAVAAREITIERVSGQGELAAVTMEMLTSEAFLDRFVREGPAPEGVGAWSADFDLGTVTAVDIAIEDEIPKTEDLERERAQLLVDSAKLEKQPEILARVKDRIVMLDMAIGARQELDELTALKDPSPAQSQYRRELQTTLARHFGTTVDRAELTEARVTGSAETGGPELRAKTLEVLNVQSDAYAVKRITGTDVGGGYTLETGAIGFGAGQLHFEGLRADEMGSTVDSVDVQGLKGAAKPIENGWRVEGLEIATLTLGSIDWGTTTKRVTSDGPLVISGVKATVEATWTGEGAAAESAYAIKRLDIEQIALPGRAAKPVVYEDLASGLRAELFAGALKGVWAQDLTIRMGAETTFEAASDKPALGFKQFDALRFSAAFGESFSVRGTLSSPEPTGGESALGITFVTDGVYAFDLSKLTLSGGVLATPDGSVRIVRMPMSGQVVYASAGELSYIGLNDFTVPDLVLGAINWKFKGGLVTARGRTVLHGITATAGIERDAEGLARATVTDAHIDAIEAEDLRYTKGPIEVRVNQPSAPGRPALDVKDVQIQGLEYERGADKQGHVTGGTIGTGPASAGLEAQFAGGLAAGTLSAETITVRFFPGDKLSVGAEDIDVAGDVTIGSDKASLSVTDVDASVDVEPKRIRIRASGAKASPWNLTLPPIRIPALDFTLKGVRVQLLSGGTIDVDSLDTDITLDLGTGDKEPAVRRVTLGKLDLGAVKAGRLLIEDPALFRIELQDPALPAVVTGLNVEGLALDQDLAGAWSLAGYSKMHADEIALDWIGAEFDVAAALRRWMPAPPPGTAAQPFNPASLAPWAAAMNSLNGHVDFKLALPITLDVLGTRHRVDDPNDVNAPVHVVIRRGEVNVAQVVEAVGWGAHYAVGFVLRGSQLVFVLDLAAAARHLPWYGQSARALGQVDVAWWNLTAGELTRLQAPDVDLDGGRVPLDLFGITQVQVPPRGAPAAAPAPVGAPQTGRLQFHTDQLEYLDISAQLSLVNDKSLPIVLGIGTITLAPFALDRMRITGNVPGAPLELGVDGLNVEALDVALPFGLGQLTSGRLLLSGLTDGRLSFIGDDPQKFTGRIARLRWTDVTMTGTPAP